MYNRLKKIFYFVYVIAASAYGQVTVTGSTGANGTYGTLKAAFDALNLNSAQAGNTIAISITASTTEIDSAVLNQPSVSSWTSLIISSTSSWTISGAITGALIRLNGADNVMIDGSNGLTFENTSATAAASTIRFINDATNNTIQDCTIKGSSISTTSGTILFSTGSTSGNDNNVITGCTITSSGINLPYNAIYSAGTSSAVDNSAITISNNNIQDYFGAAAASKGILIASNSSAWTITGNKFFQSAVRTASGAATHHAINIITASGVNYAISNNIIGYANSSGTGVTLYAGAAAAIFRAIELTVGTASATSVQGNIIAGISLSTTSAGALPGIFSGISALAGNVNIGTTSGNTIGGTPGVDSVSITSTTTAGVITGIYSTSAGTVSIQNDTIRSISAGGGAAIGYTFYGIYTAGTLGNVTIASNMIGSASSANAIAIGTPSTTTGVCSFNGITNIATGTISITGNTVQNATAYGAAASVFNGIANTGGNGTVALTSNSIISGTNTGTGAFTGISNSAIASTLNINSNNIISAALPSTGAFTGISNTAAVDTLNINSNVLRSHTRTAATGAVTGISNSGGVTSAVNIINNQLGNSSDGLVAYSAAISSALIGITNTGGSAQSALTIQSNDIRGIAYSIAGTNAHTYINNAAVTRSQNISSNTFTNLNVNTSGSVTFISNSVALFSNGTQKIDTNSIAGSFTKGTAGGTITFFTTAAVSPAGSVINHRNNNFSNVTATGATIITGWSASGAGNPTQTVTGNIFRNWTTGGAAITGMTINGFGGTSTVSNNIITKITGQAAVTALNIGASGTASALTVNSNTIDTIISTGTGGLVIGLASANISPTVTINGNLIDSLSSSLSIATASVAGINVTAGTVVNVTGNTISRLSASGSTIPIINGIAVASTGAVTVQGNTITNVITTGIATNGYTFNGILTSGAAGNFTIDNNTIDAVSIGTVSTTAGVCTFNGINNTATGTISITANTVQNATAYGTGASVVSGIVNGGGSGTLTITANNILSAVNTGTGALTGISNSAAVSTANIAGNIIRSHSRTNTTGTVTGISSTGAVTSALNIINNQLGNSSGGFVTYSAANASALTGINVTTAAASCALTIQSNNIQGIAHSVAGSSAHTYISNAAAVVSQNISSNTFTNLTVNTTGSVTFISNNVALYSNGAQKIDTNSIVTAFNKTGAGGTVTLFTSAASSASGSVINHRSNNFSTITVTGAAIIAGWVSTDAGSATKSVSNNIFTNWTGGTGAITAMSLAGNNNATYNNSINTISGAATITGITSGAGNDNIYSNTIYGLTSTGGTTTTVNGITITAGTTKNVYQNTIYNLQGNTLTTGSVNGISVSGGTTTSVYQNTMYSFTANAVTTGLLNGIAVSAGTTNNAYRNKIYDLSTSSSAVTTGTVNGILVSGAVASMVTNVSNNIIGDLRATAASGTNLLRGISITATGATSNINAYYNSVHLNASSSGATFGSSGIFHAASAVSTTAALDLRNNIIVNTSTPAGAGLTVAYRRSAGTAGTLANYASASNNNLLYAGTPSASRLIYSDGTSSAQTMTAYNAGVFTAGTISPRDINSVTENPTWLSTTGYSPDFLHIDTGTLTQIESGGSAIASYTIDFDGDARSGSTPDIGADEFTGVVNSLVPPSITYTVLGNTSSTANRTFSAIITDGTGVNTTAGTKPRVWYKKSTNTNGLPGTNDNTTNGWKYVEASNSTSPFSFTIDHGLIFGGVTAGDVIQYFVVAQNTLPTPVVGINSGTFFGTPPSVALTSGAFPIGGTINSYTVLAGLSGTVEVGAGKPYTSLTGNSSQGLFFDINAKGLAGNLTAHITSDITESGTVSLNAISYDDNSTYTLTISPSGGASRTISGSAAAPLINLNGADNVIIDGLNTGGNSLTFENTSATAAASTIRFINDATNNTIQDCTIKGSSISTTSGTILFSTGSTSGNDNNVITGCTITSSGINLPYNAIYSAGTSSAVDNSAITISNNNIQDYFGAAAASKGILIASNSSAWTITGNKFFQSAVRTASGAATHHAINIITASGVNYAISNNIIGYANSSGTGVTLYAGAAAAIFRAIELTVGTASATSVQGNIIAGISLSTTSAGALPGIFSGISALAGNVNIGTTSGNTIGGTPGVDSVSITSTTTAGVITGIYSTSAGTVSIQNDTIRSISAGGGAAIGYTFYGIYTAGTLGNVTIASNMIGSASSANAIAIGTPSTTTGVCSFNGITNIATGTISITGNTVQNATAYGAAASVFNGIANTGGNGTVALTSNSIISGTNTGTGAFTGISNSAIASTLNINSNNIISAALPSTGAFTGISNTAAVDTLNINSNVLRSHTRTAATGAVTGISNSGGVTSAVNIINNQLGNSSDGLVAYSAAISSALIGITNTGGSAQSALTIQSNDIRGIAYSIAGTNAHTYINNAAVTRSQNISSNTFTNLNVNTSGSVTFISNSVALFSNGTQKIDTNSIAGSFTKGTAGGTITFFTTAAVSPAGSVINHRNNNFSNVTATGATIITGWSASGAGNPTQTVTGNIFRNWTTGGAAITGMTINGFGGTSTVSNNIITKITGQAAVTALNIGASGTASALTVNSNTIDTIISTGTGGLVIGLASANISPTVTINGNLIDSLSSSLSIATASVAGINVTAGTVVNVTGNTISRLSASGSTIPIINGIAVASTGAVTVQGNTITNVITTGIATNGYTFNGILTSGAAGNFTIDNNTIDAVSIGTVSTTAGVCTFNGINNTATGTISITANTVQNATAYGTGASVVSGIVNGGGSGTLTITANNILSAVNTGTGALTGISNSAAVSTANIAGNIIRSHSRTNTTGTVTGISSTGAVTSALNIINNQLGNSSGGFVTYSAANASALTGINVTTAAASCALTIQSNNIQGIAHSVAGSSAHTYISNAAAVVSQNISSNTFTNLTVNTTGSVTFISNNVALYSNGAQKIDTNSIVTAFNKTGAGGTVTLFTSAASSASGSVINHRSNNFSTITVTGAAIIAGWVSTDAGSATKSVSNNIFTNWTGGTGAITAMSLAGNNNATYNNSINTISGAATITGITSGAGNDNIYSNTIYGLTSTGGTTTTVNGITITAGTTKNVYQNTIYNLQGNTLTTGSVNGISVSGGTTTSVYQNTMYSFTANAVTTGLLNGIAVSAGTTNNAYRNKIYDLSTSSSAVTTGTVNGILVSGAVASMVTNVSNNIIGDLRATAASGTNLLRGISITATGATSNINAYYNSVHLNASSSGATFGSSGIFHAASAVSTTAALDLRNNIIVNTSTPAGAGLTVAYRRSAGTAGTLANYASASNNNLLYAGTPSASRLIYSDGTSSAQTMTAYNAGVFTAGTISPRDINSVTENPTWLSTTGYSPDFLHIDTGTLTQIESGGSAIASYTIDFDGDARSGSTPDIGADEFTGVGPSNYYSKSTGNLNLLSNWGTATDGNGTAPLNFTSNNKTYYIRNNAAPTIGAAWTVSGTSSKIVVGDGTNVCNFTIPSGFAVTGTIDVSNNATLTNQNNINPTLGILATGSTVNYNGSGNQTIAAKDYYTLTSSSSGNRTLDNSATIRVANTFTAGTNSYTVTGSTIEFNGTANQNLSAIVLNNMTVNNSFGVTLSGNVTVNGVLSFTSGKITTGANKISIGALGSISGSGGYVIGNLEKTISTSGSPLAVTFEIGDAAYYTPVNLIFASVSSSGTVIASTTGTDHPDLPNSSINPAVSAQRYWTLTNGGTVYSTIDATFNFNPADVDGGANPLAFIIARYSGSWSQPNIGNVLSTSTQALELTDLGDFQVGESSLSPNISLATGGGAISADNVGTGTWTSLTGPFYAEGANGDVQIGTIILNAPPGFIFDTTGIAPTVLITRISGSGDSTREINNVSSGTAVPITSITITQITFTVTASSSNGVRDSLTWQNIRVRPSAGSPLASGQITKSGTSVMAGVTNNVTNFGGLIEVAGAMSKVAVILPGTDFKIGIGANGSATAQTAGVEFVVDSLVATDQYSNITTSYSGAKNLTYSGPTGDTAYSSNPITFNAGVAVNISARLRKAESVSISVQEGNNFGSPTNLTINNAGYTHLQILVPNETATPGVGVGKTSFSTAQTAGVSFNVTVRSVDSCWNFVNSGSNLITLSTDNPYYTLGSGNLSSGTVLLSATLNKAVASTITASATGPSPNTSSSIPVNPDALDKLQVIVPGETADPGSPTGKTGTPSVQAATAPITFTVNAVDVNWNLVSATNTIQITSNDGTASLPSNADLVGGTKDFVISMNAAGSRTITATSIAGPAVTAGTSASITINSVTIAAAVNGNAISADDFGTGDWTALTGPYYEEATSANVGIGTIILYAPSGFEFDQGGITPTVLINGSGTASENINNESDGTSVSVIVSATQITFTVTSVSSNGVTNSLTWQDIRVRPTAGAPLASGNISKSGTSTLIGVTGGTNFGTLTQIAGAIDKLVITLPGQTFTSGSGNSGSPANQTAATPFTISSITATDQYLNTAPSYSGAKTFSYSGPAGAPSYTTNVSFTSGVSTTMLTTTLNVVETSTITVTDGGLYGNASSNLTILPLTTTWDGGGDGVNWNSANNWNPNGVPATHSNVELTGANTITINVAATAYNVVLNNASLALSITTGNSLTVTNNYIQSNGAVNTATTFPAVSGTTTISGGTVNYNASGAQTVSSQTYHHLSFSGSGTKQLAGIITVNGNLSVASGVTLNDAGFQITGNASNTVTLNASATLSLGGIGSGTSFPTNYISISLNPTSAVIYASDAAQTIKAANYGNVTSSSSGSRTLSSSGTIGIAGTFTKGSNSYTVTSSTVDYNGTSSQNISDLPSYNNLIISGAGTKTLSANASIIGDITISGGTLDLQTYTGNRNTLGGTFTIAALCTLRVGGTNGMPENYSTYAFDPASIVDFYGSNPTINGGTFNNLVVASGGAVTLGANVTITGNLTVTNGTLDLGSYTANRSALGGTASVSAGATLRIGGTNGLPANYSTYAFNPASTVEFYGTSQPIEAQSFGNLTINSSGTVTLANSGTIGISGTFSPNSGTYVTTGSTIDYNKAGAQTITKFNYNNLSLSGSGAKTFALDITRIAGTLSISDASADAITNLSTIEFNGTIAQTINPITYYNLEVSSSGTKTISGAVTVNNNVGIVSGATLLVDSGATLAVRNDIDNSGTLNIDGELTYAP